MCIRTGVWIICFCLLGLTACQTAVSTNPELITESANSTAVIIATATEAAPTATAVLPPANLGTIPADDPNIRYTGRFEMSDPRRPTFDWAGASIEAVFNGTALTLLLDDNSDFYNVSIDGQLSVLHTNPGQQRYSLAQGLADSTHTFRLTKRTEPFEGGQSAFLGFELDAGRGLAALPAPPNRHLEFIGDSITAGYGNEGDSPFCNFTLATQNIEQTYAAMTARQLNASATILADSGLGVVRNYNAADRHSQGTMFTQFKRTLGARAAEDWDFSRRQPDAVVINLGTNDFSTSPQPRSEVFLLGYTELIGFIRAQYPDAHIFAVGGPIMLDPAEATIQSAVEQMRRVAEDDRVHYVPIANTLQLSAVDYGCDWHPNVSGHQKIADQLAPAIANVLGW